MLQYCSVSGCVFNNTFDLDIFFLISVAMHGYHSTSSVCCYFPSLERRVFFLFYLLTSSDNAAPVEEEPTIAETRQKSAPAEPAESPAAVEELIEAFQSAEVHGMDDRRMSSSSEDSMIVRDDDDNDGGAVGGRDTDTGGGLTITA